MARNRYLLGQIMELSTDMASLELMEGIEVTGDDVDAGTEIETPETSKQMIRRSERMKHRITHCTVENPSNKLEKKERKNSIEQYYLSRKVKRLPSTLETIYEEPKSANNTTLYMSRQRFTRVVKFGEETSTFKRTKRSKKRQMKAKKLTANNRIKIKQKFSMDLLMNKLKTIDDEL